MKTIRFALYSLPLMLAAFAVPATSAAETGTTAATSAVELESTAVDASAELGGAADDAARSGGDVTDADEASLMSTAAGVDRPNAPGVKLCCGTAGDYGVICWRC
ncbi:hypothetical protein WME79_48425 [Sorangium sp. So ce726]|uniref:hypothetical protein n=1 Tax=Sorangium sp. So ce726 TaxID=3133319 RepID=UPI003F5D9D0F